jgi:hypothetical protein
LNSAKNRPAKAGFSFPVRYEMRRDTFTCRSCPILTSPIFAPPFAIRHGLPAKPDALLQHAPWPASNAHAQSDDLLFRDALPRHDARVLPIREILLRVGEIPLA